jgi:hypothetical protein
MVKSISDILKLKPTEFKIQMVDLIQKYETNINIILVGKELYDKLYGKIIYKNGL